MKKLILIFLLIANVQIISYGTEALANRNSDELYKWIILVQRRIYSAWVRPSSIPDAYDCSVKVKINRSGEVESAEIIKSCENELLDKSILDAIWRVSPLPAPADPEVLDKEIIFRFVPK